MPLVTTKEMFQKAYHGGYAIGAFNVNNMEIVQGITEAAKEVNAPLILQVSKGARAYAADAAGGLFVVRRKSLLERWVDKSCLPGYHKNKRNFRPIDCTEVILCLLKHPPEPPSRNCWALL